MMKLKTVGTILLPAMIFLHLYSVTAPADEALPGPRMQIATEFTYHAGRGDSRAAAVALALYGAKIQAVFLSAERLAGKGLLNDFGDKKMAVFCLVAEQLQYRTLEESFADQGSSYRAKISSTISLSDFVRAEIRNGALEKQEAHFSLKDELDPVLPAAVDPAQELSKAYRYLGTQHWRMALIYLDRLEKKYPYWGDLFLAKALGFHGIHETDRMREALASACNFNNREACVRLETLEQSN